MYTSLGDLSPRPVAAASPIIAAKARKAAVLFTTPAQIQKPLVYGRNIDIGLARQQPIYRVSELDRGLRISDNLIRRYIKPWVLGNYRIIELVHVWSSFFPL